MRLKTLEEVQVSISLDSPFTLGLRINFPFEISDWIDGNIHVKHHMERLERYEVREAERDRIRDLIRLHLEGIAQDAFNTMTDIDELLNRDVVDYAIRHAQWRRTKEGPRPERKILP